ncbi:hypothetical protein HK101_007093 [Irineochytrium annulatum]|nr:hypothetical protein HK101_007093 [Irineochytrium annulatum]
MAANAGKLAIAVAKGDGIGPEIMDATLRIFDAARIPFQYNFVEMGKDIYLKGHGNGMTPDAKATVEKLGVLFKGPMETPKGTRVMETRLTLKQQGVKSINVTARKTWSTYANKRVFKTLPGVETVFSRAGIHIDLTLFRENIEDTYGGIEHYQTHDVAQTRRLITRPGSNQIHKMAFEVAASKNAKRITCCHKANIHKLTDGLFLSTFYEMAKNYPQIKADDTIVDDLSMKLVMDPRKFDFIVLPNLQGDIVSDLCAGLVGGLGMAPSANLGDRINIFEAVHGTAPDIAGKNMANPTALLMSGLMMLRQLGMGDREDAIQKALEVTLGNGERTGDLAQIPGRSPLGTNEFASAIIRNLPESAKQDFFFVHKFVPPTLPAHNPQLLTPRDKSKEKSVGIDIFVDTELLPAVVAEEIKSLVPKASGLELVMISNRGTQVWPTGSLYTEVVNYYRCRLEVRDEVKAKGNAESMEAALLATAATLAKKLRVCSTEMLLQINGENKFSKAQGQ